MRRNRAGIILFIDPPEAVRRGKDISYDSRNPLEAFTWNNIMSLQKERELEPIIIAGEGVDAIREEFRNEALGFGRRNFKAMAIILPFLPFKRFIVEGIDMNGPSTLVFDKKEEKENIFKKVVKWIKDYAIPITNFAYLIIKIAKELGLSDWLSSMYPSYQPYIHEEE
jgi:hypothetical protein